MVVAQTRESESRTVFGCVAEIGIFPGSVAPDPGRAKR